MGVSSHFPSNQTPEAPGAFPVLRSSLPSGPSCSEANPLALGPSKNNRLPLSNLMVPRAVYRDMRISFPCFLMIQVAPTTDVPRSAVWTVRFPSHFPRNGAEVPDGLGGGNGGAAGERQHPDDADGARHWRIFPRVTFAVRLLYNRRVCFPKYTKR